MLAFFTEELSEGEIKVDIARKKGGEKADRKNKENDKAREIVFVFKRTWGYAKSEFSLGIWELKNFMSMHRGKDRDTLSSLYCSKAGERKQRKEINGYWLLLKRTEEGSLDRLWTSAILSVSLAQADDY